MSAPQMRCRRCGYDLRAIDSRACPECGRRFDPDNHRTFLSTPQSGRTALTLALIGAVIAALPYVITVIEGTVPLFPSRRTPMALLLCVPTMPIGFAFSCSAVAASAPAVFGRRPWIGRRGPFVTAFVLGAAIAFGWPLLLLARLVM